jgi:uncharacterized membrane protein
MKLAKSTQKKSRETRPHWQTLVFWRDLFLYFWIFSLVGHIIEIIWALLGNATGLREVPASTIPLFAIAVPYGLGAAALRLLLYPLVQKKKINLAATFILSALLTTAIEFVCAALMVAFTGHLAFWNYSDRFLNLWGYICFTNSLLFGLGSTIALKWVFPWFDRLLAKIPKKWLNLGALILFIAYILSQIYLRIIKS